MFKITSAKKNISALSDTNNNVEFHNNLFDTDDCVVVEIEDHTPEELAQRQSELEARLLRSTEIAYLLARMKKLEGDIYYSTLTGDIDPASGRPWADVKKDAWMVLRQQLLNLEA